MVFEAYELNKSISAAANLRQAFASSELLMSGYNRALVLTDGDTMLVPADEYQPEGIETLYQHTFGNYAPASSTVVATPLAEHGAVAVTAVSKDLKTVVDDHFSDVRYLPLIAPVWQHLRHRCHGSHRRQLFAHFVEDRMWVFAFAQNRFKFCNSAWLPTSCRLTASPRHATGWLAICGAFLLGWYAWAKPSTSTCSPARAPRGCPTT